ncbi:MAG: DUF4260 family protein [Roseiarcus sp.]
MNAFAQFAPRGLAPEARSGAALGAVVGGVAVLLRIEGLAVVLAALAAYAHLGASWAAFAALFLAPDLAMAGYVAGPRLGAALYNLAHTYVAPLALGAAGVALGGWRAEALALVWIAHIGFDRALGFGLKYPTGFGDSHLGGIGRVGS